jgi:hypothetical protein
MQPLRGDWGNACARGQAKSPEAKAGRALESAGEVAGEVVPILPDWLLDADDAGDNASD